MYRRLSTAPRAAVRCPVASLALSLRCTSNLPSTPLSYHVLSARLKVPPHARGGVLRAMHATSLLSGQASCGARRMGCDAAWYTGTQRCSFFFFSRASHKMEDSTNTKSEDGAAATKKPSAADNESSSPLSFDASSSHAAAQGDLEVKLTELRQCYLDPYDKVYRFLNPQKSTTPMVMMLGNHSSGKSTLINYLAGREIQETGIAPTDDGFTVIKRDTFDMDTDGPSMVSNPKYQYQPLQQFGISFVKHFKMKTRKMAETSRVPMDMVLVDTPGMIDTPLHSSRSTTFSNALAPTMNESDGLYGSDQTRGYDFLGATRWFAQQSDVILLMFDPANPGTTGETLDVLTKSLAGYEHKFLLVMNKADVFEKVTDFGRAYGTLCWNLSKVMKMKDIPRVYTTCTPLDKSTNAGTKAAPRVTTGTVPDAELSRQRNEIVSEIMSAPIRRMDNLITETEDSARNLLLAVRAAKVLRRDYRQRELIVFSLLATACLLAPAAAVMASSMSLVGTIVLTLLSVAVGCGGVLASKAYLKEFEQGLLKSPDYVLNQIFTQRTRTKDVELRWQRIVKPEMIRVASTYHDRGANGITALPTCSARACRGMETVVSDDIPVLRRSVAEYKESYFRGKK